MLVYNWYVFQKSLCYVFFLTASELPAWLPIIVLRVCVFRVTGITGTSSLHTALLSSTLSPMILYRHIQLFRFELDQLDHPLLVFFKTDACNMRSSRSNKHHNSIKYLVQRKYLTLVLMGSSSNKNKCMMLRSCEKKNASDTLWIMLVW